MELLIDIPQRKPERTYVACPRKGNPWKDVNACKENCKRKCKEYKNFIEPTFFDDTTKGV